MKKILFISLSLIGLFGISSANAQVADTFNIVTNIDTMKSPPTAYYGRGLFPADTVSYRKVYLNFTLGCGGGCSGWDYTVDIYIVKKNHTRQGNSITTYEIARMITPYGGYYAGAWTNPYRFDVTDFSSLLHDSVEVEVFYSGWTNQFTAQCSFEVITGIPDHNPYSVTNMWSGSFPYGSAGNPISNYLPAEIVKVDTGAHATRLRILQTGHGEDDNNCTEFCANYQHVFINGVERFTPLVWRDDCGMNALLNQAGTWLYDRANWCPGDLVNPYLDDLTPYVTRGTDNTIQINMDPYITPNGGSIYIFGTTLIFYGPVNFKLDAAVEDIIAPNMYAPYSRINPVCGNPEVVIRNTGSDTLKSLTFNYGQVGGAHYNYTWNGNLPFDDTALVSLPPVDLKSASKNKFEVTISNPNGGTDQYANNNYMQVPYDTVPDYPSSFVIKLKTNLVGYQYSYFIKDASGNIVDIKSGFGNSTTYLDTVNLVPGCYHFEMDASGKQGLYFFANSNGTGSLQFIKLSPSVGFNTFQPDFGTSISQNFNVGEVYTGLGKVTYNIDYSVYPNPAKNEITLAGLNASLKDKTVRIYSSLGALVYENTISGGLEKSTINIENLSSGIYCVIISNADGQAVKKIMVTK